MFPGRSTNPSSLRSDNFGLGKVRIQRAYSSFKKYRRRWQVVSVAFFVIINCFLQYFLSSDYRGLIIFAVPQGTLALNKFFTSFVSKKNGTIWVFYYGLFSTSIAIDLFLTTFPIWLTGLLPLVYLLGLWIYPDVRAFYQSRKPSPRTGTLEA